MCFVNLTSMYLSGGNTQLEESRFDSRETHWVVCARVEQTSGRT